MSGIAIHAAQPRTAPQEQASALAVPEVITTMEGAVAVATCNKLIAVVLVDGLGRLHPVEDIDRKSPLDVQLILAPVARNSIRVNVPCNAAAEAP